MRPLVAFLGVCAFAAIAAIISAPASSPARASTATTVAADATADPNDRTRVDPEALTGRVARDDRVPHRRLTVRGLAVPIADAGLPVDPELLPNAARDFRAGWHEGIDFPAPSGTPVRAVLDGTVIRVDREFTDWTADAKVSALDEAMRLGYTPAATLDRIRGRQVWIDHGRGIVSRYAHLASVADLAVGAVVRRGAVLGTVGSSGYPEGGPHLHLEIRLGSSYLGDGLSGDALGREIASAFDAE